MGPEPAIGPIAPITAGDVTETVEKDSATEAKSLGKTGEINEKKNFCADAGVANLLFFSGPAVAYYVVASRMFFNA